MAAIVPVPVPLHNIGTDRLPQALTAGMRINRQKVNTPDAYRSTTITYLQEKIRSGSGNRLVPEIIDPVFAKTSQNARFLLSENERFGLVFVKTGSLNSGTGFAFLLNFKDKAKLPELVRYKILSVADPYWFQCGSRSRESNQCESMCIRIYLRRYKNQSLLKDRPGLVVNFEKFPCSWIRIRIQNSQMNADPGGSGSASTTTGYLYLSLPARAMSSSPRVLTRPSTWKKMIT